MLPKCLIVFAFRQEMESREHALRGLFQGTVG